MGNGETGGAAALPIWIGFMEHALKNVPESFPEAPEGLTAITANDPAGKSSRELIYKEQLPPVPPSDDEGAKQEPAPVQDAKPKAVEKPLADKPGAAKETTEKAASDKPPVPKPAEKKP